MAAAVKSRKAPRPKLPSLKLPGRSRALVTLSLETSAVRVATFNGSQASRWTSAPLSPGLVRDGLVFDPDSVAGAVDSCFQTLGVPKHSVVTALSGYRSVHRILSLPRMDDKLLAGAVTREAKREFPVAVEDLYLAWQKVQEQESQAKVYVVGVPREMLDALVQTLRIAGVETHLMDLKPLALVRAIGRRQAIIVNMEPDSLDVIIVDDYLPVIPRTISFDEGQSPDSKLSQLLDEVSKTVRFFNDTHRGSPLHEGVPIYPCGELMPYPLPEQVEAVIREETGHPVEPPQPALEFPEDFPLASYAVNVGLALKKGA